VAAKSGHIVACCRASCQHRCTRVHRPRTSVLSSRNPGSV